jgi:hypothetical protein
MVEKVEKLNFAKRDGEMVRKDWQSRKERLQGLPPPPRTSPWGSERKENFPLKCGKKRKFNNRESWKEAIAMLE